MGSIKYYQLAKNETPPDEFCAVRDIGGEPSEYTFYVPEAENAKLREDMEDLEGYDQMLRDRLRQVTELQVKAEAESAKLRELIRAMWFLLCVTGNDDLVAEVAKNGETIRTVDATAIAEKMHELGIEVG